MYDTLKYNTVDAFRDSGWNDDAAKAFEQGCIPGIAEKIDALMEAVDELESLMKKIRYLIAEED